MVCPVQKAKKLAPFLTFAPEFEIITVHERHRGVIHFFLRSGSQFRKVKEKEATAVANSERIEQVEVAEVNECHDALHTWLNAFYTYSSISDQVCAMLKGLKRSTRLILPNNKTTSPFPDFFKSREHIEKT